MQHFLNGQAWFDEARGQWWRQGLDVPITLPAGCVVQLKPSLGERAVAAQWILPIVVGPLGRCEITVAWPACWAVFAGETKIDQFRPGERETLIGTPDEGQVVHAVVTRRVEAATDLELHQLLLHCRLSNQTRGVVQVRRVVFHEAGLTLWQEGDVLHAGDVRVEVLEDHHAEAWCAPVSLPEGALLLRRGDVRETGLEHPGLRWWLDATRRSVEFSL